MAPHNASPDPEVSQCTRRRRSSSDSTETIVVATKSDNVLRPQQHEDQISYIKTHETVISTLIFLFGFTCGTIAVSSLEYDPRMDKYPFLSTSLIVLVIGVFYIVSSFVIGPWLMRDRGPMKLKKTMLIYNAFQVLFSAWMFYEVGASGWFFDYSFTCQPCDFSHNPKALRMAQVAWCFYFSKMLDFLDTKFEHVSVLHVVHHSCMYMSMFFGVRYMPGGHITFMGYLNTFVHAVMYSYYLLAALGPSVRPYLWWKKYLTKLQLIQFVAIFFHAAQVLFRNCPSVPIGLPIWTCIYAFIFFVLFMDFYKKTYKKPKAAAHQRKDSNDNIPNGILKSTSVMVANGVIPNGISSLLPVVANGVASAVANGKVKHQ